MTQEAYVGEGESPNLIKQVALALGDAGGQATPVGPLNPVPVQSNVLPPFTITAGQGYDFTHYGAVVLEVSGLTSPVTISGGSTAAIAAAGTYPQQVIINRATGVQTTSITANGRYSVLYAGNQFLAFAGSATVVASAWQG